MAERTLIRGGYVLTQDPELGEQAGADVLIEDESIAAVGRDLPAVLRPLPPLEAVAPPPADGRTS